VWYRWSPDLTPMDFLWEFVEEKVSQLSRTVNDLYKIKKESMKSKTGITPNLPCCIWEE
jgi:hypothetical protein